MSPSDGRQIAELRSGDADLLPGPPDVDPAVGRVKMWATNDTLNGIALHFKSKGRTAWLIDDNEVLGILARQPGVEGNGLSVEIRRGPENSPLDVRYNRVARSLLVILATTGDALKATTTTQCDDPPYAGDRDLVFTAKEAGTDGNALSVIYEDLSESLVEETTLDGIDGTQILISLAQSARVPATVSTAYGANKDVTFSSPEPGALIRMIVEAADYDLGPGPIALAVYNDHVQIHIATGTLASALVAWAATNPVTVAGTEDPGSHALHDYVTVALKGGSNGSGAISVNFGDDGTATAGGSAPASTATAAQVKAAIEGNAPAHALIDVAFAKAGGDGHGTIGSVDIGWELTGGAEADTVISGADDVIAAIEAVPAATADFATKPLGEGPVGPIPLTNLNGGDSDAVFTAQIFSD